MKEVDGKLIYEAEDDFGPCQFCEFQPTHAFMGFDLQPTCQLCAERLSASHGMLRQVEFFVI